MYEADWCGVCRQARAFFEHNGISYTSRDVDADPNVKEKARRLSGNTSIPVIVIDGKVMQGFSEEAVQSALTSAVKSRVLRRDG